MTPEQFNSCGSCEKKILCGVYFEVAADNVARILSRNESQSQTQEIKHIQAELHSRQADEGCDYRRVEVNAILSSMQG